MHWSMGWWCPSPHSTLPHPYPFPSLLSKVPAAVQRRKVLPTIQGIQKRARTVASETWRAPKLPSTFHWPQCSKALYFWVTTVSVFCSGHLRGGRQDCLLREIKEVYPLPVYLDNWYPTFVCNKTCLRLFKHIILYIFTSKTTWKIQRNIDLTWECERELGRRQEWLQRWSCHIAYIDSIHFNTNIISSLLLWLGNVICVQVLSRAFPHRFLTPSIEVSEFVQEVEWLLLQFTCWFIAVPHVGL